MYEKGNPSIVREENNFPDVWKEPPRGSHIISAGKSHLGREMPSELGEVEIFHKEVSIVPPAEFAFGWSCYKSHFLPILCHFPTLEVVIWWLVPFSLVLWENAALEQPNFHFSICLDICCTDVLGCIWERRKRCIKELTACRAFYFWLLSAHWCSAWWQRDLFPAGHQRRACMHCPLPLHVLQGTAFPNQQIGAMLCFLLKEKHTHVTLPAECNSLWFVFGGLRTRFFFSLFLVIKSLSCMLLVKTDSFRVSLREVF